MTLSPQNLFLLIWGTSLLAPLLFDFDVSSEISFSTTIMILANISSFYIVAKIMEANFSIKKNIISRANNATKLFQRIDFIQFEKNNRILFYVWLLIYLVNIVGSNGVPLAWSLMGDARTYVDFGLPTLNGLGNMFRAFLVGSCFFIWSYSNLSKKIRFLYAILGIILILLAFIVEMSRGAGVLLLLQLLGLYLLPKTLRIKDLIKWAIIFVAFSYFFGVIQVARNPDGLENLKSYAASTGMPDIEEPFIFFIPALNYILSPIQNLDNNIADMPLINFQPYYVVETLLPTVIREKIFERGDYGNLVNDANNASTFYFPLIRDFGIFGGFISVLILQILSMYFYLRAKAGDIYHMLCWPAFFMSWSLSFFYLFFASLVVVLYPVLVFFMLRRCFPEK